MFLRAYWHRVRFIWLLPLAASCAPALSSFQPGHVARRGGMQLETGMDVSVPTGPIIKAIDAGETLSDAARERRITEAEQREVLGAATNLALNPPFLVYHFGLAYGLWRDGEVGLRYASGAWQIGARQQLLHAAEHGVDLSAGLTISRQKFQFPVQEILDIVHFDDFVRWNVGVPVVVGKQGSWYRLWGGPRFLFSTASTGVRIQLPAVGGFAAQEQLAKVDTSGVYVGGQAGVALGYKSLFLGFELTVVQLFASADLQFLGAKTNVDMDSLVIYPAIALMGDF